MVLVLEWKQLALGMGVSVTIGALCRVLNLPIPAPPSLVGVLMIGGLALGYAVVGLWR